ncbi:hypothetical protein NitYY0826_C1205 [Nitratiruptor sp. YY08-26]|uniref:DUF1538 domain-containing protein n=1 Tax=unclassified Nitratiruptor TaxID=2624044 RepID=UPI001916AD5E|nr:MULTISPECIES: DUF1538 domain-containing protein [unclassified Nitratiruptor]BCD62329.1 hypothetical protein NitYY0813_C1203 [Nitratiruptor sp. YY08-13]BCD66265.1 hypothetical protein NitYY0826_C1205 [Nitratiruptor sp. YY08-26]
MEILRIFFQDLKNSFQDLLPIVVVVAIFQFFIIGQVPQNSLSIVIGLIIVAFGLAVFIRGLELGIFPIGENLAIEFAKKGSLFWLLLFAFLIGFSTTIAEPALIAIAQKSEVISQGKIDAFILRLTVALSVGFAIALGVFRIIVGHPIQYYIIVGYILVVLLTFFAPKEIVGLAYDSGGVTTSTVTVPLVAALGIGLATSIKGRNPVIDGFGLIAFASLTPMIFVQIYGIIASHFGSQNTEIITIAKAITQEVVEESHFDIKKIFFDLIAVVKDILPILGVIFFFQYIIIKRPLPHLYKISFGILLVIIGLYAFILGLEIGLFPIGETLAFQLTSTGKIFLIYLFAFLIGFSTTMAEPALLAIAIKAQEVSENRINSLLLRVFVALGVAIGIALGAYRIVTGGEIHYYIIVGYIVVILLTYFAPKYIIPIAYDSGGVTTSTVTVPLVAALGLGLAQNIPGRDPLIDGFGLIAFASLFPMITVMGYGIYAEFKRKEN